MSVPVIVQRIEKKCVSDIHRAIKYYTVLFSLNDLAISPKQIELIAFTAVRGTITSPSARKEFIEMFDSSPASLENTKCKLVKMGWLVKLEGKYKVRPLISLDFTSNLIVQIKLFKEETIITNDRVPSESSDTFREVEEGVNVESE